MLQTLCLAKIPLGDPTFSSLLLPTLRNMYNKMWLCTISRSLYASFDEETTYRGIHVYKYVSKKESIENNEENECFCPVSKDDDGHDIYECPTNGLINIMPCVQAPILVSYPHFYLADRSLLDYVRGIKPDPELHGSFAYFEPVSNGKTKIIFFMLFDF